MQQVGGGVVERGCLTAHTIDFRFELVADADAPLDERADVRVRRAALQRIGDDEARAARGELACIADLAAGLGVERCAIEHYLARIALLERFDLGPLLEQRYDPRGIAQALVAAEQRGRLEPGIAAQIDAELARLLRAP